MMRVWCRALRLRPRLRGSDCSIALFGLREGNNGCVMRNALHEARPIRYVLEHLFDLLRDSRKLDTEAFSL